MSVLNLNEYLKFCHLFNIYIGNPAFFFCLRWIFSWFPNSELILYVWNKSFSMLACYLFIMPLNSVCRYLEILYCSIQRKASFLLLLLGWKINGVLSPARNWGFPHVSYLWNDFWIIRISALEEFIECLCKKLCVCWLWRLLDKFFFFLSIVTYYNFLRSCLYHLGL